MQKEAGGLFINSIKNVEIICSAVTSLITPELYDLGFSAIDQIKDGEEIFRQHENSSYWDSPFTAMQIIVNRLTLPHRDKGGCQTHYDLLLSAGTHTDATLHLRELNVHLSYPPGTLSAICGKVLMHEVPDWGKGERICLAHFIKDDVHARFNLPRPSWPNQATYFAFIGK